MGSHSAKTYNISIISGVKKWSVDGEKCFSFWAAQNTDCSICIRVCPYNKDYSKWFNRVGLKLASTLLRNFILWIDMKLSNGKRHKSSNWWAK
jgi:ferredoxin